MRRFLNWMASTQSEDAALVLGWLLVAAATFQRAVELGWLS